MLTPGICVTFVAMALAHSEKSAFSITLGNLRSGAHEPRMAVTTIQLGEQKCTLWSMGEEKPSSGNDSPARCSGDQPLRDGARARWACRAKPGGKFTKITIGPRTYDLAEGRLFLLSGRASEVKVLQLDRDPFELGPRELMRLAKEDPMVRAFFGE